MSCLNCEERQGDKGDEAAGLEGSCHSTSGHRQDSCQRCESNTLVLSSTHCQHCHAQTLNSFVPPCSRLCLDLFYSTLIYERSGSLRNIISPHKEGPPQRGASAQESYAGKVKRFKGPSKSGWRKKKDQCKPSVELHGRGGSWQC